MSDENKTSRRTEQYSENMHTATDIDPVVIHYCHYLYQDIAYFITHITLI